MVKQREFDNSFQHYKILLQIYKLKTKMAAAVNMNIVKKRIGVILFQKDDKIEITTICWWWLIL